jgi:hypothetical protein
MELQMVNKIPGLFENLKKLIASASLLIGFLMLLVGIIWTFHLYVHSLIKSTLKDPEMVELVSSQIRPVVIFDSEKRILYGKNVMDEVVGDFSIDKESGVVKTISIKTKKLLNFAPILESLDEDYFIYDPVEEKYSWTYKLKTKGLLRTEEGGEPRKVIRFRLEFIR